MCGDSVSRESVYKHLVWTRNVDILLLARVLTICSYLKTYVAFDDATSIDSSLADIIKVATFLFDSSWPLSQCQASSNNMYVYQVAA